jgi:SDR family mycofactocin-dependent oxidoreductase
LAEEGADIIAIDLCEKVEFAEYPASTLEDLEETVRQVESLDRRIIAAQADVRDPEQLKEVVDAAVADLGRLDVVAANAGVGSVAGPLIEADPAIWQQELDINLLGVWNTCRVAVPHIVAGGNGGAIVITSSAVALKTYMNIGPYSASKRGALSMTTTLAAELGPDRIRVNAIVPTQVGTDMVLNEKTYKLFSPDIENPTQEDFAAVSEAMHMLPTPWVESVDISNALLFLVSDEARYITAVTLPVDAGSTNK